MKKSSLFIFLVSSILTVSASAWEFKRHQPKPDSNVYEVTGYCFSPYQGSTHRQAIAICKDLKYPAGQYLSSDKLENDPETDRWMCKTTFKCVDVFLHPDILQENPDLFEIY